MIVDPDFFSHWRTRMVVDMLGGDELAPLYIMRLWAHCQNRKGDVFDIPPAGVKALCQFSGDAATLEDALVAAEYMARDGATVTVIGWAEKNASLIAAWGNGHKGGRPKKNPKGTQQEPMENPEETKHEPSENPWKTQAKPIREDKRREEELCAPPSASPSAPAAPTKTGTRLPEDWTLPEPWRQWATETRPDLDAETVADSFRDFWVAKPGKDGRKADWLATWRNWVRNQKTASAFAQRSVSSAFSGAI